jgi:hypothetical protein
MSFENTTVLTTGDRRAPTIHGDGGRTRDVTCVENVRDANVRPCVADAGDVPGRVSNVGCGERDGAEPVREVP